MQSQISSVDRVVDFKTLVVSGIPGSNPGWGRCFFFFLFSFPFWWLLQPRRPRGWPQKASKYEWPSYHDFIYHGWANIFIWSSVSERAKALTNRRGKLSTYFFGRGFESQRRQKMPQKTKLSFVVKLSLLAKVTFTQNSRNLLNLILRNEKFWLYRAGLINKDKKLCEAK